MSTATDYLKENGAVEAQSVKALTVAPSNPQIVADVADQKHGAAIPVLFHLLAAAWIVAMLLLNRFSPDQYYMLMQEDRIVEWGTVGLFFAAAITRLPYAVRHRRIFDILVALFCLFVAGEEFSWGQRLLGFDSPEYFLGNNIQQELNFHNMAPGRLHTVFLSIALAGYGILLPILSRYTRLQPLLYKTGAIAPPIQLAPWFILSIVLMIWYPVKFTGEWVEFLVGGLFFIGSILLASTKLTQRAILSGFFLAATFGAVMTKASDGLERGRDVDRVACADAEAQALLNDLVAGRAATKKLRRRELSVHKRIWAAENSNYLRPERLSEFNATRCSDQTDQILALRHQYAVDPWGTSYWLIVERLNSDQQRVIIYSFGPNRRRDGKLNDSGGEAAGDDIVATGILHRQAEEHE